MYSYSKLITRGTATFLPSYTIRSLPLLTIILNDHILPSFLEPSSSSSMPYDIGFRGKAVLQSLQRKSVLTPSIPVIRSSRAFSTKIDSFLSGSNSLYVEQMYDNWLQDPKSVHISWAAYFTNLDAGVDSTQAFTALPSVVGTLHTHSSTVF
jgi:hypothetical protein